MAKSRRRGAPLTFLLFLFISCILLAAGVWVVEQMPLLAAREFGQVSPALDGLDRLIYSARVLAARNELLNAANPGGDPVQFEIAIGESVNSVVFRLEQVGVIRSADALRNFIIYAGWDTGIQAGKFELDPGLSAVEIARQIQKPAPTEAVLVILPGWRAEEVAAALPTSGLAITPVEFMAAVRNPPTGVVPANLQPLTNLEGYLFPGDYRLPRETSLDELLATILSNFDTSVSQDVRDAFPARGFTLEQAVTLASLVQKEGILDEEQPMIASVFYNRLAIGMKLDSDPTAQYAFGYNNAQKTWWTNPVTAVQLGTDSPYNTYIYAGLPPGPIASPGLAALQAVAFPAESPYYYFRARCDGSGKHEFAVTYEEQIQNACQ